MDTFVHKSNNAILAKTRKFTSEKSKVPLLKFPEFTSEVSQSVSAELEYQLFKMQSSIDEMKARLDGHMIKTAELEKHISWQEKLMQILQGRIKMLEAQNIRLLERINDQEHCEGRNNSRLISLPEVVKDDELLQIFEKWLSSKLGLRNTDIPLKMEWTNRVGVIREDNMALPVVARILNFAEKCNVMPAYRQHRDLDYKESKLGSFPDFLPQTSDDRRAVTHCLEPLKCDVQFSLQLPAKVPITFEDVTVNFSQEEWEDLEEWQKELYKDVMKENYETIISLEQREEPYVKDELESEERETGKSSCSESDEPGSQNEPTCLEENMESSNVLPEGGGEDVSSCSGWEGNCRDQYILGKKRRTSTGDSAGNSTVCVQIANNVTLAREKHIKGQRCLCDVCGMLLMDSVALNVHQGSHIEEGQSTSTDSRRIFSGMSNLQEEKKMLIKERPFSCSKCQKSFTRMHTLIKHQKVHETERSLSCTTCGRRFTQKSSLKVHQKIHLLRHRIHTGERPFSCKECAEFFIQKTTLEMHPRIHPDKKTFSSKSDTPFEKSYTEERPSTGTDSRRTFSGMSNLQEEQKIFTKLRPFSCSKCQKSFTREHTLIKHQKVHDTERSLSCTTCGRRFTRKTSLKVHQKIHLLRHRIHTGERPFSCKECAEFFIQKTTLEMHPRIHPDEKTFSSSKSDTLFENKCNLTVKHKKGERPFSCKECAKTFTQKDVLEMHQRNHTEEKPLLYNKYGERLNGQECLKMDQESHIEENPLCTEREKNFQHNNNLIQQQIDTGEKPSSSIVYGDSFFSKVILHLQQNLQRGDKPFSCSECGMHFTQKTSLDSHRLIHRRERSFTCTQCDKTFRKKYNLIIHQQGHTGAKPFSCSECKKRFTRKANLKSHQRIHMRETIALKGI
uniref:Zinc finger protein 585A-like isoform X2 n=1 Tax=Geotrypetes seraphini TaxID=260995 RepID=A0A6P8QMQ3_GEOSA|nr:zinc finger protein 585A-like isoform X2 [Geotrypetes seraphini]